MWKRVILSIIASGLLLACIIAVAGCDRPATAGVQPNAAQGSGRKIQTVKEVTTEMTTAATEAINADDTFIEKVNKLMPADKNYMFSPLSVKMAVAMAANGARGNTQTELLTALGINDITDYNTSVQQAVNKYKDSITKTYTDEELESLGYQEWSEATADQVEIANSIWLNTSMTDKKFKDTFKSTMKQFYNADANDVTAEDAVDTINSWVSEKTRKKIPEIIDSADFSAALVNAVYFKGAWDEQFNESATEKETFTDRHGKKTDIDFMSQRNSFDYYEKDGVQMLHLPYRNDMSMYVILNGDKKIADVKPYLDNFTEKEVIVKLPKFHIEYSDDLVPMFTKLGVKDAFTFGQADFTDMLTGPADTKIDKIYHKTYIDTDENGTEAAAATAVMMTEAMALAQEPAEPELFMADKPFTFIIRDDKLDEVFFIGEYAFAEPYPGETTEGTSAEDETSRTTAKEKTALDKADTEAAQLQTGNQKGYKKPADKTAEKTTQSRKDGAVSSNTAQGRKRIQ